MKILMIGAAAIVVVGGVSLRYAQSQSTAKSRIFQVEVKSQSLRNFQVEVTVKSHEKAT